MLNKNRISRKMLMVAPLCLALALLLSACGGFGADWMWQESSDKEPNTGDMIVHVTGSETETVTGATSSDENAAGGPSVFAEGVAVAYTGEAHPGTDICYEGSGANRSRIIVIDAGHQIKGNAGKEPIGPGAAETKYKVSGGTASCNTGSPESELTLAVSKLLEAELIQRGYTVLMTRTEQDVNISNSERAAVANDANADAFVRIHANGSENSGANGALTICQTAANPYNSDLYAKSRALSDAVLDELTANAGCRKEYVWETDTMSGINWCRVPVTIVEIGYMTNAAEDALLATDDYRSLIAVGIANGIDRYFRELSEN